MPAWKTILVPTDFSDASTEALHIAADLARSFHSTLVLLHVAELPSGMDPQTSLNFEGNAVAQPVGDHLRQQARSALERFSAPATAMGLKVEYQVRLGSPSRGVIDTIVDTRADLVVIGTHGRTGLAHFFMGSVAERVVHLSPVPVLTVRKKDAA